MKQTERDGSIAELKNFALNTLSNFTHRGPGALDAILKDFHPEILFIPIVGAKEIRGLGKLNEFLVEEFRKHPDSIDSELLWIQGRIISNKIGIVDFATDLISMDASEIPLKVTMVCLLEYDGWKIINLHSSTSGNSPADELSPFDELRVQNAALENEVVEQANALALKNQALKKADRESRKEHILEKIRSRTMAMQHSTEFNEVVIVMYEGLKGLGINPEICVITLYEREMSRLDCWASMDVEAGLTAFQYFLPCIDHPFLNRLIHGIKSEEKYLEYQLKGAEKRSFDELFIQSVGGDVSEMTEEISKIDQLSASVSFMNKGMVIVWSPEFLLENEVTILKQFSKVVDLSYTRFSDLQKAEAQAREAQIEVAMERIRSRAIAMRTSEELLEVIKEVRRQIDSLGQLDLEASVIHIYKEGEEMFESIAAVRPPGESGEIVLANIQFPVDGTARIVDMIKMFHSKQTEYTLEFNKEAAEAWQKVMIEYVPMIAERREGFVENSRSTDWAEFWNFANFSDGSLILVTHSPASKDTKDVLRKAAQVFDLAYQRYKDLVSVEAQVREAEIEVSLERIRARTMAMSTSNELIEIAKVVYKEMVRLEVAKIDSSHISILNEDKTGYETWYAVSNYHNAELGIGTLSFPIDVTWSSIESIKELERGKKQFVIEMNADQVKEVIEKLIAPFEPERARNMSALNIQKLYANSVSFTNGILVVSSLEPLSKKNMAVLLKIGNTFDLSYRRFIDLKKAENQVREAEIEAALERVRSKTMAMHRSEELSQVISKVYMEFKFLGFKLLASDLLVFDNQTGYFDIWVSGSDGTEGPFHTPNIHHPHHTNTLHAWKAGQDFRVTHLKGEDFVQFFDIIFDETNGLQSVSLETKNNVLALGSLYHTEAYTKQGCIRIASIEELTSDQINILKRFARVFEQSYTRFEDLLQAEAQAIKAIQQASLDRVRAEIASMRTTEDLQEITPLLWKELTSMQVPFFRCGVFIMDEESKTIHTYLTNAEGEPLAMLKLPFEGASNINSLVQHWQQQQVFTDHWDKETFVNWFRTMIEQGQSLEEELLSSPPDSLHLHFVPFTQGMLYVGSLISLAREQVELLQRLASTFDIAYARYDDFKQIEKAKERTESTLKDLQATQNQLIQSEKMASLGELTAGIAHEIKNPLNFVNNFSELNTELLVELEEELNKGNYDEVVEIARDIRSNAEKINQHGKRADGIVKSMLQHSRTTGDSKELTDLNILADEYLRLSYHGFRAKDKSFNSGMKMELDADLPKIKVIPQEIGRVLLNLMTNAFYIVNKKSKQKSNTDYKAMVTVKTNLKEDDTGKRRIVVSVIDNGTGIPRDMLDKIFQPFFTTKPTGEGTGLGLSLAYDIVTKGHGGELRVESQNGEGTRFIISLPIN